MPLLYLLHQPVGVDSRDTQGHTALMWAAYQGDAECGFAVEAWDKPDGAGRRGLTLLHWAVVRGNRVAIRRLVEKGAVAKDAEGRTPCHMAVELKSLGAWRHALEEGGWDEEGVKRKTVLGERSEHHLAIFALPTLVFGIVFMTLAGLPWYTGVLLAVADFSGHHASVWLGGTAYMLSDGL
ncbi:hypothetical protein B0H14DRAFT_3868435 [Mycena olivaceomarginata]|nr:hypothetical protein B0H14DRAFT_3868435 [Mycena olivaceomarginata]